MFTFSSKKGNRRREAKKAAAAAAESQRPRLERRNAVKNIDYDLSRASTSSDESMSLRCTRSLDLSPVGYSSESSFRIGGSIDGEAEHIYRMLGLSGPDDFGIPVDAWEASLKTRLSSDLFPRSRLLNSDSSPRNPEICDLTFEDPAGSRASDIPPESPVGAAALSEEVGVRPPETKESVSLEETGEGEEETEKISRPFAYRNYSDDAGISVTLPQPSVTASLSPASVHSPLPEFAPSTSKTVTVDNKLGSTLECPVISEDNGFKLSTEASSDWAGIPVKEEPVEIRQSFPVSSSRCDVGIKGTRPPVLIPPPGSGLSPHPMRSVLALPPSMSHPNQDRSISAWDIVRSFAPTEENEEGGRRRSLDSEVEELEVKEEEEEEDECVENGGVEEVMERAVTLVETTDGAGSFSTTNDDDSSSTTTEFVISPIGHFKKQITSWMRGQLLGSGSFGTVYEGISDDGTFIAIKEVSLLDKGSSAQQCILQLEQEIALLSQFEHENIVQYYGTDKEESKLVIFLELVTQGSLASLYQKYNLRDTQVSAYTRQILNGLNYLHERNVVHRDIKCANILVHANGSVKLADFGLAKEISKFSDLKSCKGSVYWMAPEVVHPKKTYGRAADIWSLGCTVLELLTRQIPFPNVEWQHAFFKIGRGDQPPIPNHLSAEAQDFIRKCVQVDPSTRPSAAQLLEHPFITRRPLETFGY